MRADQFWCLAKSATKPLYLSYRSSQVELDPELRGNDVAWPEVPEALSKFNGLLTKKL